jgi:hypothetical protein
MSIMTTLKGIIRGKTIELESESGFAEGQPVSVRLCPIPKETEKTDAGREALRSVAGAWSDDDPEGLDRFLEWNRQARKVPSREIPE